MLIERFVEADVGDGELGAKVLQTCEGVRSSLFRATPSLEHVDSLLSLTG